MQSNSEDLIADVMSKVAAVPTEKLLAMWTDSMRGLQYAAQAMSANKVVSWDAANKALEHLRQAEQALGDIFGDDYGRG